MKVLKPCPNPWCISRTPPLPCALKREGWNVRCACGVVTFRSDTEEEARAMWNRRTTPTNEEVVSVLEEARDLFRFYEREHRKQTGYPTLAEAEKWSGKHTRSEWASVVSRFEKAERNKQAAERLDDLLSRLSRASDE